MTTFDKSKLPSRHDVLVINAPWLYFAADLEPPGRKQHSWSPVEKTSDWLGPTADALDYAILASEFYFCTADPTYVAEFPPKVVREFLESHGLEVYATAADLRQMTAGREREPSEILLFRRKAAR